MLAYVNHDNDFNEISFLLYSIFLWNSSIVFFSPARWISHTRVLGINLGRIVSRIRVPVSYWISRASVIISIFYGNAFETWPKPLWFCIPMSPSLYFSYHQGPKNCLKKNPRYWVMIMIENFYFFLFMIYVTRAIYSDSLMIPLHRY